VGKNLRFSGWIFDLELENMFQADGVCSPDASEFKFFISLMFYIFISFVQKIKSVDAVEANIIIYIYIMLQIHFGFLKQMDAMY
jgi:hypothetical protein